MRDLDIRIRVRILVEVYYIAKYLLSAKVNYDLNPIYENQEMKLLYHVVESMLMANHV